MELVLKGTNAVSTLNCRPAVTCRNSKESRNFQGTDIRFFFSFFFLQNLSH